MRDFKLLRYSYAGAILRNLRWRVVWLHITRGLSYKDIIIGLALHQ